MTFLEAAVNVWRFDELTRIAVSTDGRRRVVIGEDEDDVRALRGGVLGVQGQSRQADDCADKNGGEKGGFHDL